MVVAKQGSAAPVVIAAAWSQRTCALGHLGGAGGVNSAVGLHALPIVVDAHLRGAVFAHFEWAGCAAKELLPDASLSRAPSEYVALLQSLKTGSVGNTPIMVSGVLVPGAAPRYEAVVRAFGGTVLDIGTPDWGSRLSDIGRDTFSLTRRYTLVGVPLTGTVTVTVDGRPTTDFVLDVERNTVILDDAPRAGAEVLVRYQSGC